MRIAISSKSGCGNTTVSKMLAEKLGYKMINFTFRQMAEERGVDFWTFCKNELPLLRLANTRTTLEDIFLELTSSESSRNNDSTKEDPTDESNL